MTKNKIINIILDNIKTIKTIPKAINNKDVPQLLEIRCEIFIGKKDFSKICQNYLIIKHR